LKIVPLEHVGAKIEDVDLSSISEDEAVGISKAASDYGFALIQNQPMNPYQQIKMADFIGDVPTKKLTPVQEKLHPKSSLEVPGCIYISNELDEDGNPNGTSMHGPLFWHQDGIPYKTITQYTLFHCIVSNTIGGRTMYVDMRKAWNSVPQDLKEYLKDKKALHAINKLKIYEKKHTCDLNYYADLIKEDLDNLEEYFKKDGWEYYWHPVCMKHPVNGRECLIANPRLETYLIEDTEYEDAMIILDRLLGIMLSNGIYEHTWSAGDTILWDNISAAHARKTFPDNNLRKFRRCAINLR